MHVKAVRRADYKRCTTPSFSTPSPSPQEPRASRRRWRGRHEQISRSRRARVPDAVPDAAGLVLAAAAGPTWPVQLAPVLVPPSGVAAARRAGQLAPHIAAVVRARAEQPKPAPPGATPDPGGTRATLNPFEALQDPFATAYSKTPFPFYAAGRHSPAYEPGDLQHQHVYDNDIRRGNAMGVMSQRRSSSPDGFVPSGPGLVDGEMGANGENSIHYSRIPQRVSFRFKTKRVELFHSNFVIDCPVAKKLLDLCAMKDGREFTTAT
ncbi:hypothetical protein AURDEDRAFT_165816 [Auricularia subglabra TFB-10046 SS5]|nr:hypothetical protein AURDEDRAFT_165816 [Auricularia subglabra TFB-10046 SS5]